MVKEESSTERREAGGVWQSGTLGGEERELTDEAIAGAARRIGVEQVKLASDRAPLGTGYVCDWEYATKDAIRRWAEGIGDINPLWWDEEYARKTRWGKIIAQPGMYYAMGVSEKTEFTPEERASGRGGVQGLHAWYAGDDFEWFQPIYVDDRLTIRAYLEKQEVKQSSFTGRRTLLQDTKRIYRNQRSELVLIDRGHAVVGGRQRTWGERKKYADLTRPVYTPEDIGRIEADYEREEIRGANPRFWEDVNVGDDPMPVVKGPLTVTDIIAHLVGYNLHMYRGAHRLQYEARKRHPLGYAYNSYGVPDLIERVHWEDEYSQKTGNPMAYDYGPQRVNWLFHVLTNWMGDDAFLWRVVNCQLRNFVYIGDTCWAKGKVTKKYITKGNKSVVDLDAWVEDHRGRITCSGKATVILPSRERGPVPIPVVPEEDSMTP